MDCLSYFSWFCCCYFGFCFTFFVVVFVSGCVFVCFLFFSCFFFHVSWLYLLSVLAQSFRFIVFLFMCLCFCNCLFALFCTLIFSARMLVRYGSYLRVFLFYYYYCYYYYGSYPRGFLYYIIIIIIVIIIVAVVIIIMDLTPGFFFIALLLLLLTILWILPRGFPFSTLNTRADWIMCDRRITLIYAGHGQWSVLPAWWMYPLVLICIIYHSSV